MIWDLFEAVQHHARATPEKIAVLGPGEPLTYAQLHHAAAAVAADLRDRGIGQGHRVALDAERAPEAVVVILGIVGAGAAYVPLDPKVPAERRRMLLQDCGSPIIACGTKRLDKLVAEQPGVPVVSISSMVEAGLTHHAPDCLEARPADAEAYVIYTSGSTGRPKGVRIRHSSLRAFLEAVAPVLEVDGSSRSLNTAGLQFDASVASVLLPLVAGGGVHLGPPVAHPALIVRTLEKYRMTHMTAVGSTLTLLATSAGGLHECDLSSLRVILTGGEVVSPESVQTWLSAAPSLTVVNGYGPTEATCGVSFHRISEREPGRQVPYPIGQPLATADVAFLTEDGGVTRRGPGELLIAGAQVMAGYLDRPEEEARAFLWHEDELHYRTGDIAHRTHDGILHFDGRRDDEVKINGYRVNLNEVRAVIETHPAVAHAFVRMAPAARFGTGLECVVVTVPAADASAGDAEDPEGLSRELGELAGRHLPRYMVPERIHPVGVLPTHTSGKPDVQQIFRLLPGDGEPCHAAS